MIKIYPFKAFLPVADKASQIASEPYDVISTEEARQKAEGNEISYLQVVRPEIGFAPGVDPYGDAIYDQAAQNLQKLIDDGLLVEDKPGLYIYRQTYLEREQFGIVCCYDVKQYRDDKIKKHEKTRPDKEDDRTRHLTTCSAHAEPVFLSFRDTARTAELIKQDAASDPVIDFTAGDGVQHTIWRVADAESYVAAFSEIDSVYIADGHHRTAAGERAATQRQSENPSHTGNEEYNRVLSVMFPSSHLKILAYNRVVKDLNGLSSEEFIAKLAEAGSMEPTDKPVPDQAGCLCISLGGNWYHFRFDVARIDHNDPIDSLDVALLQNLILDPILGVGDPRIDLRIGFVGGIRGTLELEKRVDSGSDAVAFSMYPTSIQQLFEVSDAGKIMPPKSTWFEPKLRSGLFVHRFEKFD